jgi:hypothetical protein
MNGLRTALSCAILAACAPLPDAPGAPSPSGGVYPRGGTPAAPVRGGVHEPWTSSSETVGAVRGDAALRDIVAALPAPGSVVPLRALTWPARALVEEVSDTRFTVAGGWVDARALGLETRCHGAAPGAARLVVEVDDADGYLAVEARLEWATAGGCEVSRQGAQRLQRAAMDVFVWVRRLAQTGSA